MTKNKRLLKLVNLAVTQSFEKGKLNIKKVTIFVTGFKKLPSNQAIFALSEYLKGIKRVVAEHTAIIESPVKLSDVEINKIIKPLNSSFLILNSEFKVDPSLLGGVKVKIGDTVLDHSVSRKIEQVRKKITGNI